LKVVVSRQTLATFLLSCTQQAVSSPLVSLSLELFCSSSIKIDKMLQASNDRNSTKVCEAPFYHSTPQPRRSPFPAIRSTSLCDAVLAILSYMPEISTKSEIANKSFFTNQETKY